MDNDSTDGTLAIARTFLGRGVFRIERAPYRGMFALHEQLRDKERLAAEIDADWYLHHDADEIREAPPPYSTLRQGIEAADRFGFNAINFDEFVFLPTSEDESFEGADYVAAMQHYYFFEPHPLARVNAWKKLAGVAVRLAESGGHSADFPGRRIFPVSFVLRHYVALSRAHAIAKYAGRVYSRTEVADKGWHRARASFAPERLRFPPRERLKRIGPPGVWDRSDPWRRHEFLGEQPPRPAAAAKSQRPGASADFPPAVYIVGVPRSGTTLLRLMLDAHPEVSIPPETHFVPAVLALRSDGDDLRREIFAVVTGADSWPDFHVPAEAFRQALADIRPFDRAAALRCFYRLYAGRFGKARWGDKTPGYTNHLRAIQELLPEARFVHVIRDGRDVALSSRDLWFGPGADLEAQASNWLWRIREARQQGQGCTHYLEVRYEDLVVDTRVVLERVCRFLELPYDPIMEAYHHTAAARLNELGDRRYPNGSIMVPAERRRSFFAWTLRPPDVSRIERWRTEMPTDEKRCFEVIARDMLLDLGYAC